MKTTSEPRVTDEQLTEACRVFFGETWSFAEVEMLRDAVNKVLAMRAAEGDPLDRHIQEHEDALGSAGRPNPFYSGLIRAKNIK